MANSADPDLDLHCLQRQDISGLGRTRNNKYDAQIQGHNSPICVGMKKVSKKSV